MPKVTWSPQVQREKAMEHAIARAKIDLDLKSDRDVAEYLEIDRGNFSRYKLKNFQTSGFKLVCRMARKLNFTAKEWCDIAGIPYKADES